MTETLTIIAFVVIFTFAIFFGARVHFLTLRNKRTGDTFLIVNAAPHDADVAILYNDYMDYPSLTSLDAIAKLFEKIAADKVKATLKAESNEQVDELAIQSTVWNEAARIIRVSPAYRHV